MLTVRLAGVSFLGLLAACTMNASMVLAEVTVCQLAATPQQPVHLHATAWVALRHGGALLRDANCPRVTYGFRFADDARDRPMVKKLSDAMTGDAMNLEPRIFDVRLVGQLSAPTASDPTGLFIVSDVEGFEQHRGARSHTVQ